MSEVLIYPATAMSICLVLAPLPTIVEINRKRSVQGFSPIPYAVTAGQSALWWVYAKQINKPAMIPVNAIQVVVEMIYCAVFYFHGDISLKARLVALLGGLAAVVVSLFLLDFFLAETPGDILFYFTILLNILMFASPLATLKEVIKTQNAKLMPLPLSLATFCCGLLWFLYGIGANVMACVIPNGVGVILGAFQLAIIYKYRNSTSPDSALSAAAMSAPKISSSTV